MNYKTYANIYIIEFNFNIDTKFIFKLYILF